MEAIRRLRKEDIPISVRIDPLFPRNPLGGGKTMADFGLPDVQPLADLEALVRFCRETGVKRIVYSVAKITLPRTGRLSAVMEKMKQLYEHLSPRESLVFRGGAGGCRRASPRNSLFALSEFCVSNMASKRQRVRPT